MFRTEPSARAAHPRREREALASGKGGAPASTEHAPAARRPFTRPYAPRTQPLSTTTKEHAPAARRRASLQRSRRETLDAPPSLDYHSPPYRHRPRGATGTRSGANMADKIGI